MVVGDLKMTFRQETLGVVRDNANALRGTIMAEHNKVLVEVDEAAVGYDEMNVEGDIERVKYKENKVN